MNVFIVPGPGPKSIAHLRGLRIVSCLLALSISGLSACGTTVARDPFRLETAAYDSGTEVSTVLGPAGGACQEIDSKRIVRGLFLFPMTEFSQEQREKFAAAGVRFRHEVRGADLAFTTLGFLFGFVTHTVVVEQCETDDVMIARNELARLRGGGVATTSTSTVASTSTSQLPTLRLPASDDPQRIRLRFAFNSAEISKIAAGQLDRLAGLLARQRNKNVLILGHSDDRGDNINNLQTSWARAFEIKEALKKRGVAAERIFLAGAGNGWPQSPVSGEDARTANRSVSVILIN